MSSAEEPEELPWFSPEPPKPPERYRKEEMFLWVWRVVLLLAIIPAAVLAYMGAGGEVGFLAPETDEDVDFLAAFHFALTVFLGAQMLYYFYLSWSFRRFKDWGLVFWLAAGVVVVLGMVYPVG
jgi:hypothetical protein